jgi:hypothetical protein
LHPQHTTPRARASIPQHHRLGFPPPLS